jgi:hypothetical protein
MPFSLLVDGDVIHAYDVSMRKIQVLFPEPQLERLRKVARLEDRPISEIIRRATEEYLAKLPFAPRRQAEIVIPVFHGGKTLISGEHFRDIAHADRTGARP